MAPKITRTPAQILNDVYDETTGELRARIV